MGLHELGESELLHKLPAGFQGGPGDRIQNGALTPAGVRCISVRDEVEPGGGGAGIQVCVGTAQA